MKFGNDFRQRLYPLNRRQCDHGQGRFRPTSASFLCWTIAIWWASPAFGQASPAGTAPSLQLIPWFLDEGGQLPSISEASSHFEDLPRELLNPSPDSVAIFPHTSEDRVQRSGYPDLRLVETATSRIFYLDPKLYAAGSRGRSFRTFYFEPKITTNKARRRRALTGRIRARAKD